MDRLICSVQQELYSVVTQLEVILNHHYQEKNVKALESKENTYQDTTTQDFIQEQNKIEQILRYISVTERWLNQQNALPVGRWERI